MGWLFAVALALHRRRRSALWLALPPIALGHGLSIVLVASLFLAMGALIEPRWVQIGAGLILIGWAAYHQLYGHRHRVRIGLTTGAAGLTVWSFLMATAHGAGLMLLPPLIPLCLGGSAAGHLLSHASWPIALAAVGVHMAAMLVVTAAVAAAVYEWVGLAILRTAWINLDLLWTGALAAAGVLLLILAV